jgi:hypothetical protein
MHGCGGSAFTRAFTYHIMIIAIAGYLRQMGNANYLMSPGKTL